MFQLDIRRSKSRSVSKISFSTKVFMKYPPNFQQIRFNLINQQKLTSFAKILIIEQFWEEKCLNLNALSDLQAITSIII